MLTGNDFRMSNALQMPVSTVKRAWKSRQEISVDFESEDKIMKRNIVISAFAGMFLAHLGAPDSHAGVIYFGAPEFLVGNCGAGLNVQSACYPICYSLEVTECAVSSGSAACEL